MCTVSWIHTPRGYELFCNRDEAITRESAFAPGAIDRNGVRVLAPLDGRHGGTWIAVNEFGLALCLTNGVRGGFGARGGWVILRLCFQTLKRSLSFI